MNNINSEPLDDQDALKCLDCGAAIWPQTTTEGRRVALEKTPGPYLILDRDVYESTGAAGYGNHWDHCHTIARSSIAPAVGNHEFLWNAPIGRNSLPS